MTLTAKSVHLAWCALETAKDAGWTYRLLADREWAGRHTVTLNPMVNSICLSRTSLDDAFDSDGWQVGSLTGLVQMFINCGGRWRHIPERVSLTPSASAQIRLQNQKKTKVRR